MNNENQTPRLRFRLFSARYSLRALGVAVTLAAVTFGALTERARRQRDAVSRLQAIGVTVTYDYQLKQPVNGQQNPSSVSNVIGIDFCHNVVSVHVHDPTDASAALPIVKCLPRLRTVIYCWNNGFDQSKKTFLRYTDELGEVEIKEVVAIVG